MTFLTFTSDFGASDGYVGEVKGVALGLAPTVRLVDIAHGIAPGDVRSGSWVLLRIWSRFPEGTVHLVVVDPGVGSDRRAIAASAAGRWFVGPDNGLLSLVAAAHPVDEARELDPGRVGLPTVHDTFHGRDLFAPAAARLARGDPPQDLGPALDPGDLVLLPVPAARREGEKIVGEVVHVDRFGNLVTNVPSAWLPEPPHARIGGRAVGRLGRSFRDVEPGELILLRGSGGTLEVAVRDGDAARELRVARGARVEVGPAPSGDGSEGA